MIWLDTVVIVIITLSTPISFFKAVKEAQRTGTVAGLIGACVGVFMNGYIIWRLWS